MRRIFSIAMIIVICFLLQSTIFRTFAISGVSPNLMIIIATAFGFMRGRKEGLFVGFFSGMIVDLASGGILGFYSLIYMLVGYINGYFADSYFPDDLKLPVLLMALSDFVCNIAIYVVMFLFSGKFTIGFYLGHIIMPELIYTMIVAVFLYFILLKINRKLEEIERRNEAKFV